MIIDLPSTNSSKINRALVDLREKGGSITLGRVLTLVIITDESAAEDPIAAANAASFEHPCRVIVVARGARRASPRMDAQIRVGGDAGASEVVVLRLYGTLVDHGASVVVPLLLADAPVVAWWPGDAPEVPADDPIGALAQRRITDAAAAKRPGAQLTKRIASYRPGDTDLSWTRITRWRGLLAATMDQPPHDKVTVRVGRRCRGLAVRRPARRLARRRAEMPGEAHQVAGEERARPALGHPVPAGRRHQHGPAADHHRRAAGRQPTGAARRTPPPRPAGLPGRGTAPTGRRRRLRRGALQGPGAGGQARRGAQGWNTGEQRPASGPAATKAGDHGRRRPTKATPPKAAAANGSHDRQDERNTAGPPLPRGQGLRSRDGGQRGCLARGQPERRRTRRRPRRVRAPASARLPRIRPRTRSEARRTIREHLVNNREVVIHGTAELLAATTAARLVTRLVDLQSSGRIPAVALTGGGVGTNVLRHLNASPARDAVDWSRVEIFWGDDRFVPSDDPERNERQASAGAAGPRPGRPGQGAPDGCLRR